MIYSSATAAQVVLTHCAVCSRPLTDADSVAIGIGPDCREMTGYSVANLSEAVRAEFTTIIRAIASEQLNFTAMRAGLFRLHALGFVELAKKIQRRTERRMVQEELTLVAVQAPQSIASEPVAPAKVELPFTLTEGQDRARVAVQKIMSVRGRHDMCIIAGFAGTGKTSLLRVFAAEYGVPVCITPTGKAALRVREATGLSASTIHRWLYKPVEDPRTGITRFVRRTGDDIEIPRSRMILLDEASMVGPDVWKDVYTVCKQLDLKLICVGDGFQLPPVQAPGLPPFSLLLPEFAQSLGVERVEMTEVLRQAAGSPVIRASTALRQGWGLQALRELPQVQTNQFGQVAVATYQRGGVIICHRNQTRFFLNAGMRQALGIVDEMPQVGEPLLCLRNVYEAGVVNGEAFTFGGWTTQPDTYERIYDRWKPAEEDARFGATLIQGKTKITLAVEELHGKLTVGVKPIMMTAQKWSRLNGLFSGDTVVPHVNANFGYAYTGHKGQGSQWPWVLVVLESSVRLDEEEGRRWAYTAVTRSQQMSAIHLGNVC